MSPTLLVVEDDLGMAENIRDVLRRAGYEVPEPVASGAAALEAVARLRPALVLMDLVLDGLPDGIDTAQQLRERYGTRVVYLTGLDDTRTLERAKLTAPLGYLTKPFDARALRATVEMALHNVSLESALAAREQWFATTLQSIGDAVLTTDGDDLVTFMNRAAEAIVGVRAGDAIGKKVDEVVRMVDGLSTPVRRSTPRGRPALLPREARLMKVGHSAGGADGAAPGAVEIEGSIAPIALEAGNAFGTVMVFRDVGERRQLERRLGMTERLAAIGTMASGMQHEINNPLASVLANVQFALDSLRESQNLPSSDQFDELVRALEDASEGAERIRRTVEDLRHFTRSADSADAPIELTTALEDAMRMAAHTLRHHATVRRQYGKAPSVRAEEGQLARVFMNLLLTAARATGDGGAAQHTIVLITRTDREGRAVAEVIDDGPGIPPALLHRIFDPFFTTAPEHAAMGLALAVCHSIVTSLGGEIDVESVLGKGTTFRVSLPPAQVEEVVTGVRAALPPATEPPMSATTTTLRRPRILVIDDEIAIGNAIRRILSKENDVTLESDARAALQRLGTETYDIVFCDLMMPHMSGMDFFEELSKRAPDLAGRVVFVTGGALSPRSEEFLRATANVCLAKPFSQATLTSVIRKMVG